VSVSLITRIIYILYIGAVMTNKSVKKTSSTNLNTSHVNDVKEELYTKVMECARMLF
jgi:hypothetical protein